VRDAEHAQLRVLGLERLQLGRAVEELPGEVARERDERDARARGHDRGELHELRERGAPLGRGAHDDGRAGLDDEAADGEAEASWVAGFERARARHLPGIDGRVGDRVLGRDEREDAWIAARRFRFECHRRDVFGE
jgi:hypothetical protein